MRVLVWVWVAIHLLGCDVTPDDRKLQIVCTTGLVGDLVANIAGDAAEFVILIPAGTNPHNYEANDTDSRALAFADVVFHHGLGLEQGLTPALSRAAKVAKVESVTDGLPVSLLHRTSSQEIDPHIWLDPLLWKEAVGPVVAALSELRPNCFGNFKLNGERYRARLDTLHQWIQTEIARVAPDQKLGVTFHEAFGYFGRAYGVEIRGLADDRTTPIDSLVAWVVQRQAKTLFPQSHLNGTKIDDIFVGFRTRGVSLERGGMLYSDALKESDAEKDAYVGTVRANVNAIVDALQ